MNKLLPLIFITALLSCNNSNDKVSSIENKTKADNIEGTGKSSNEVFKVDPSALTKDYMTWYTYTYYKVPLSEDFIGLDIDSQNIDKLTFLRKIQLGNELPFKIRMLDGRPVYKLYNLRLKDESIKATIEGMAATEIAHFKMEGTEMQEYNFTDLNGNKYSKSSTNGKLMVVKCWFIHCVACVAEFPDLNKLVDENRDNPNVLFVSLAIDSKEELQKFLKAKEFKYAVVPETKDYMADKMGIKGYPTHLLINGEGKIIKVVRRIEELIPFLNIEKAKVGQ